MTETPLRTGDGDDYFRIGAIKLFADGSLGGRTAALETPYSDDPGNNGILVVSEDELREQVYLAHAQGMQVAIHAIGDRAVKVSLNAISSAQSRLPVNRARHRLVHVQILSPLLITEMRRVGIVADVQPKFLSTDMHWAVDRVGNARMRSSYSWRTMLRAGVPLAGGSDCPVEPLDPLYGIYCAVTRKDMEGEPPIGFFPNERLPLDEAIKMFTAGGAYGAYEEHKKGSLIPENMCDFVALSDDILTVSPDDIKGLRKQFLQWSEEKWFTEYSTMPRLQSIWQLRDSEYRAVLLAAERKNSSGNIFISQSRSGSRRHRSFWNVRR